MCITDKIVLFSVLDDIVDLSQFFNFLITQNVRSAVAEETGIVRYKGRNLCTFGKYVGAVV